MAAVIYWTRIGPLPVETVRTTNFFRLRFVRLQAGVSSFRRRKPRPAPAPGAGLHTGTESWIRSRKHFWER
jgi:hypothetical protein